jgi:hypothetical protein
MTLLIFLPATVRQTTTVFYFVVQYWVLRNNTTYSAAALQHEYTAATLALLAAALHRGHTRTAFFVDSLALLVFSYPRHYFNNRCRANCISIGFRNGRCRSISVPCAALSLMAFSSIISASAKRNASSCFTHIARKIAAANGLKGFCILYLQWGIIRPKTVAFRWCLVNGFCYHHGHDHSMVAVAQLRDPVKL